MSAEKGIQILFPDDLKTYMETNREGTYTLLDVRQPFEYEEAHLPGAKLIPLPKLADSFGKIDPSKPTIVYCAVGGRSLMAAKMLAHQGFREVFQLQGGIDAWEQTTASGPVEFHLEFVSGDEGPEEIIRAAYRMEEGLKGFHEAVLARTDDHKLADVVRVLVKAEEKHMRTLADLLSVHGPGGRELDGDPGRGAGDLMEGGFPIQAFLAANERYLNSVAGFMELAMMVETQALDLYLRMAGECRNEVTRSVLIAISEEEKSHLGLLGQYMDRMGT